MRDRYERLYLLPGLLYCIGSPLLIEAGALLKDNQNNNAVAQLKFRNISDSVIKAVSVMIFALDTAQRPLGDPVIFQYLDLSAKRDENFGQDVPVILPDPGTRAFYVSVREIIFENNEVWNGSENVWQPLPAAVTLNDFFKDSEMTKQFKMRYGSDSNICPIQIGDLWYCACGKINNVNELSCHSCGKNANELLHVNLSALAREKEERLQKEAWEKQLAEQKAAAEKAQKEAEENAERERIEKEREEDKSATRRKRIMIFSIVIALAIVIMLYLFVIQPVLRYKKANDLFSSGEFDAAIAIFRDLGDYKDCKEKVKQVYYKKGEDLVSVQDNDGATSAFCYAGNYLDASEKYKSLSRNFPFIDISEGWAHTLGLKSNGMVVAVGNNYQGECDVCGWTDIMSVTAGGRVSVGLRKNGTVVATGENEYGQCDVSDWQNIVAIDTSGHHTVGLKTDGTVIATGNNESGECDVSDWRDIVAIAVNYRHTVGLKSNGKVVITGECKQHQCDVSDWRDIVAIETSGYKTIGLKSDGTVVISFFGTHYGDLSGYVSPVTTWRDIVAISVNESGDIFGIKENGTVVADWSIEDAAFTISGLRDIVKISGGSHDVIGLKSDGTITTAGNCGSQCIITEWNNPKGTFKR